MKAAGSLVFVIGLLLQAGQSVPPQIASMDGQVTNALTGEPVPNALIHLLPLRYTRAGNKAPPQTNAQTDGAFHFESLAPGDYVVTAERSGFVPNELNTRSRIVTVSSGQALTGVAVVLTPQGAISGRVQDEEESPIADARVEALAPFTTHGRTSLKLYSDSTTDSYGNFALSKLPPNGYYVVVEPPAATETPKAKKPGDLVRTIYPRSLDMEGASTVPVSAGQSVSGIAIRVRRITTFHIRGKVADVSAGADLSNLTLAVSSHGAVDSPSLTRKVPVKPNRTFDIGGLTPGAYTLRLIGTLANSGRAQALLARDDVEISGANLDDVLISILPALAVTGQVRVDSSANVPLPAVTITARPLEDLSHSALGFTKVGADGSFAFNKLDPGPYLFQAISPAAGWYVKSLTLNQQDVLNKSADLSAASVGRLEVLLSPGAGEVDVAVQAAAEPSGNAIVLAPEIAGPDGAGVLFGYSRQDGTCAFKSVRPGKYFAYVTRQGDPNLWQNPGFLNAIQDSGISLDVGEKSRQQIQVPLLPLEQVEQAAARIGLQI